jgi:hypothetical protein
MIYYAHLFAIRKGLTALNGIKDFNLGVQRAKVANIINPEIEAMEKALENQAFYELNQEINALPTEEAKAQAREEEGYKKLKAEYQKQCDDYNAYLRKPYEKNNIPKIDASLFPKDTDTEIIENLFPIINFTETASEAGKKAAGRKK